MGTVGLVRVIGSGFGRTGTRSLKEALELLGFGPCYHMEEVLPRSSHVAAWARSTPGTLPELSVFDGFGSAVDFPASLFAVELAEAFPDAKVVHTVRDPDEWYDSCARTIAAADDLFFDRFPASVLPPLRDRRAMLHHVIWDGLFEGRFADRAFAIETFERWTAHVIASVPSHRLLVYELSQGWGPLCELLEVPVPREDLPRVNDADSFRRRLVAGRLALRGATAALGAAALVGTGSLARRYSS